ncbi:MAG: family 10 glycosylhydrolase [Oscillospiraceae bacterium]|nr:family 10 glycosylhydrolase [Oscillospiraceae bacterium]
MRKYSVIRFFPFVLSCAMLLSACRNVSEKPPLTAEADTSSVTVILPIEPPETTTETVTYSETEICETSLSETSDSTSLTESQTEAASETAAKSEATAETAVLETETTTRSTETVKTETETTTVTTAKTAAETTTLLTLQYESPSETTVSATAATVTSKPETEPVKAASYGSNSYNALNFREQKGFWITYLEYGSILKNKSESSFKKSINGYFKNISDLGFNTVYVQVRAFGDAYYDSELFPSGEQFDGTIGTSNRFDALQVMVDCAHEQGLSIHAWVNPMRLMSTSQLESINSRYTIKKWYDSSEYNGKYIVKSGDRWYLNPAYDEVTDLISSGISEIAANYDVDGIQIDDYFYPTTDTSFDKSAYAGSGTSLSLAKWRISNVNKMVKKLYKAAHGANSSIVFGISPQGSIENNYDTLYADVRTWCAESGYCDYILPQVYFGFENAALPYADVISAWSNMVKTPDVKLVIGLAAYKIGVSDNYAGASGKNEWINNSDIISRQMTLAKALDNYGGVAIYRYDSLFNPSSAAAAQVSKEIKNIEK